MKTDKTTAWIGAKLRGENPATPPDTASQRPDAARLAAIKNTLANGPQAPSDTPGDTTDIGTPPDFDQEARDRINDPEILAALDNPDDELHSLAKRIYDAYVKIAQLDAAKAAQ
jgi:hypothetical protein